MPELNVKPLVTPIETVLFCRALALPNCNAPALIVVGPVNVFAAASVVVPEPIWVTAPVPLTTLLTTSAASLRSKLNVALSTTAGDKRAGASAAAELQRAGVDERRAGIRVAAAENQGAAPRQRQTGRRAVVGDDR